MPNEVRPLFDLPIFTGQKSAEDPSLVGDLTFHNAVYFLPMLYAYLDRAETSSQVSTSTTLSNGMGIGLLSSSSTRTEGLKIRSPTASFRYQMNSCA